MSPLALDADCARAKRLDVYQQMKASLRLEDLMLDSETEELFQEYVAGTLTLADVQDRIHLMDERDFGRSIRLPAAHRNVLRNLGTSVTPRP